MRRLETERLHLEPVDARNAVVLWEIMQGPDLREFQDVPRYTLDEFERRVAARPSRLAVGATGRFEWLIYPRDQMEPAGWVSLRLSERTSSSAELGYSILPAHRRLGYAAEAARAIVAEAFERTPLARVEACCVPANAPSRRLLRGLGFRELRKQKHGAVVRGVAVDIVVYEVRREEWALRASSGASSRSAASS